MWPRSFWFDLIWFLGHTSTTFLNYEWKILVPCFWDHWKAHFQGNVHIFHFHKFQIQWSKKLWNLEWFFLSSIHNNNPSIQIIKIVFFENHSSNWLFGFALSCLNLSWIHTWEPIRDRIHTCLHILANNKTLGTILINQSNTFSSSWPF